MRFVAGVFLAAAVAMPAAASQHDQNAGNKDKKTCRSEQVIGSIIRRQICHTSQEWAAIDGTNSDNAHSTLEKARQTYVQPERQ